MYFMISPPIEIFSIFINLSLLTKLWLLKRISTVAHILEIGK